MSTRLTSGGRLIDRSRPVSFRFNGARLHGCEGDTLASALLANDRVVVGRSFKYHRPRGIVTSGPEEPNALLSLGEGSRFEPNTRATVAELSDGMTVLSQNHWPSLEFDIGRLADKLSRFLPAGFYYKTFIWPRPAWVSMYEPLIRRAAGLGKPPRERDPDRYEHCNVHVDVLVIGGGIAGLLATREFARSGSRVLLLEQSAHWGGRSVNECEGIDGISADKWIQDLVGELGGTQSARLVNRTTCTGIYDHGYALALQRSASDIGAHTVVRQRLWRIRAKRIVLASGAIERPVCFAGNDIPGVMLASAVRDYVLDYGVSPGDRTVVLTNNDDAYRTAFALVEAGLTVSAILDIRPSNDGPAAQRARHLGIPVETGKAIAAVKGSPRITGVSICAHAGEGAILQNIDCDCVAMSGGWSPTAHLWSHCGGQLKWDAENVMFRPDIGRPPRDSKGHPVVFAMGAANGNLRAADAINDVVDTVPAILRSLGLRADSTVAPIVNDDSDIPTISAWVSPNGMRKQDRSRAWVDFQNDVKVSDIDLATLEGYTSSEHAKRYTTLGMATDQGKLSNVNGVALLSKALNLGECEAGTTTFRPPYTPVSLGAVSGDAREELFKPVRKTPMDGWHADNRAVWEPVGDWRRPYCYLNDSSESVSDAVRREAMAVRKSVGILDATTLGKILVKGKDAGRFLDMLYTNMMSTLKPGRCRYGLMCNENGFLMDDGVVARIDEETFLCHTTTGGADHVHAWMEEWLQCEWWNWKVYTANLTEAYAQIGIAGPNARRLLQKLGGLDLDAGSLPFMSWTAGRLGKFDAKVYRISFSGEISFEIAVSAGTGPDLWMALLEAGQEFGVQPYGTEALHVLRAEKGYIMIGDETDGTVIPQDLGLEWAVSKKKRDFLGKRAQERPHMRDPGRWKLVGLKTVDSSAELPSGSHAIGTGKNAHGHNEMFGRVTSSYFSPILNRTIALALIRRGPERMGEVLHFSTRDGPVDARVTDTVFYDPEGTQLNA